MRANAIGEIAANESTTKQVPWYQQLLNALPGLATTYLSIEQQRELNKINLSRANQGLPALQASDYQPGIQAGLNRSTQNTLLLVAFGIGGAILLSKAIGGKRR